ncbi:MAG: Co2+/Mg2+ efflux protein ApaG [Deltaproteobacteria bacterium]|nr:Co2+/Mg2+ efflux protein ApaG [Deltaproteobacteria bacterium]
MGSSKAVTRGVRIEVSTEYDPARSFPEHNRWFYLYTVEISNDGSETVQLVSRHWIITDASGHVEEVKGPGVVGESPVLEEGESFQYTSGCPLTTPYGTMHGTYQMVTADGDRFDAQIAEFLLGEPRSLH